MKRSLSLKDKPLITSPQVAASLEAGAQVHLHAARRQLAGGLAERTVSHARVDAVEVGAVKQIENLAFGLDLHLFREEPRNIEVFLEGEIEVLVSGPVEGVAAKIPFHAESRRREIRGREDSLQELALRSAAQVWAKRRHVG